MTTWTMYHRHKEMKLLLPNLTWPQPSIKKPLEIDQWIGDPEYTLLERTWVRNSMDVTGIRGGYIEGKASIIADSAWFRVMTRTGPGQDPGALNEKIMAHVKANTPWGVKVEMASLTAGSAPYFPESDLGFRIGYQVQTDFFGVEPKVLYVGGWRASTVLCPRCRRTTVGPVQLSAQ